jgi:antitoxin PrlF
MPEAVITSKGQTTIPKKVRDHLRLNPGDRIDFVIAQDGRVFIRPATRDVMELAGILARSEQRPVSVEEMNRGIQRYIKNKFKK